MKTRIILLYISITLLSLTEAKSQWNIEKSPVNDDLNSIFLINAAQKWIVGNNGVILNYSKGFWEEHDSPTKNHLYSVYMNDEKEGWAVGSKGIILHYKSNIWNEVESPTRVNLYAVRFSDTDHGLAVGECGTIIEYKEGHWSLQPNISNANLFGLSGKPFDYWIGGSLESVNVPIINLSNDLNIASAKRYNNSVPIQGIAMLDNGTGWAVGGRDLLVYFDGSAWEKFSLNFNFPSLRSIFFDNHNDGICVGYEGTILEFKNDHWSKTESGTKRTLNSVTSMNGIAYAVGNQGTILSTAWGDNEHALSKIGQFDLSPNPADTQLSVYFNFTDESAYCFLSIYDLSGKMIREIEFPAYLGNNGFILNTADIEDGVYLLKLRIDLYSETQKMVIQHQ